jgi:hypothetical protein
MSKPEDMEQLKRDLEIIAAAARTPYVAPDTPQQKAILRQNKPARKVRADFPAGTRVEGFTGAKGTGAFGTVKRHVPHTNAQGGVLVVEWDSGTTGRHSPISVRKSPQSAPAEEYPEGRPEDDPFECDELLRRRRNRGEKS